MDKCGICGKLAIERCAQCGMPPCKDHIEHGIKFKKNETSKNCPNCKKNIAKLTHKLSVPFFAIFIIIVIVTLVVLNSVFSFL